MKNKAFTLIEIIAALVILAVIALIAIPIVTTIIEKSEVSSYKSSVNNYGRAIENAIHAYELDTGKKAKSMDDLNVEYSGSKIKCNVIKIRKDQTVFLSECYVDGNKVEDKTTYDKYYHYGMSDYEYVDAYGKTLEKQIEKYIALNGITPNDISEFDNRYSKYISCSTSVNFDGTVYLTGCSIDTNEIKDITTDDGYYHYGSILYAVDVLLSKANNVSVANYTDGNTSEMYTFEHPVTSQTGALIDYRYIGANPNNYVIFNNELWRIIGVFTVEDGNGNTEQRIKIVRNGKLSSKMAWDSNNVNEWSTSTLNTYLNVDYYNGLDDTSKNMVATSKYYLGGSNTHSGSPDIYYSKERGRNVYSGRSISWNGKIALMYLSDYYYTYALGVDDVCYIDGFNCKTSKGGTPTNGWIYNINSSGVEQWFLTPRSDGKNNAFQTELYGNVYHVNADNSVRGLKQIQPTLYLLSQVKIDSGVGSENEPYKLKL